MRGFSGNKLKNRMLMKDVRFLMQVIDKLDEAVLLFDGGRKLQALNAEACRMLDLDASDVLGSSLDEQGWSIYTLANRLITFEDLSAFIDAKDLKEKRNVELRLDQENGQRLYVSLGIFKISEEGEELLMVTLKDVSEKHGLEDRLKASENVFAATFEYSGVGIVLISMEHKLLRMNRAVTDLLGYTEEELVGTDTRGLMHPADASPDALNLERLLAHEIDSYQVERRLRRKDGVYVWVMLSLSLVWEHMRPVFYVVQLININEGKRLHEELEHLNLEKSKILSLLSHDVRAPLASIQNYLELLGNEDLDAEERNFYNDNLLLMTRHTREMISNLLFWSKSQLEGFSPNLVRLDPENTLERTLRVMSIIAGKKNITIESRMEDAAEVRADREMLELIVRNLITNAVKFTAPGGRVSVEALVQGEECVISVSDTGNGIDPAVKETLFSLQTRSTYGTGKEKGIGLGLVLCKSFTEMQGGRIWLESEPGKGTSVFVALPLAGVNAAAEEER